MPTTLQQAQERANNLAKEQKNSILDFSKKNKQETDARISSLQSTPKVEPDLFENNIQPVQKEEDVLEKPEIDTFHSIDPVTKEKFNEDGTKYEAPVADDRIQQATELKDKELEDIKEQREKAVADAKRGFALGRAKFEENKENYANYDEVNTKYNAVVDEITASMSDSGVIDESVYQNIADRYGLTIEQVKNPNRILDGVELTDEGKENLGINNFEADIEDRTKNFDRSIEDLEQQLTQTQESYNQQISDASSSIQDVISGARASGAASGLFRSTALESSIQKTRDNGANTIQRMQNSKQRAVGDVQKSISRLNEDFTASIEEARREFDDSYRDINTENMLTLNEIGLTYEGDELIKQINQIEDEFSIKSQEAFSQYLSNLDAINSTVESNLDIVDRIADQEEQKELKSYNSYLENDGILLQSSTLAEITQRVQEGALSVESAQNLRKIMQTSIQSTLGALAPLELGDIDNINYLLEQGYTPEQAIALMQESFDKFQPKEEEITQTQDWAKLDDRSLFNKKTGETRSIEGSTTGSVVEPSGSIIPVEAGNKTVYLDEVGAGAFDTAFKALESAGIPILTGKGHRDQAQTIKEMADRLGFSYNESNPAETAAQLRSAGHAVADPGHSKHEHGTAIDVYKDGSFAPVTPEQESILNENGWFSANIPGDLGHFEYKGVGSSREDDTILGVTGAPLSFERQIKQKVPQSLQNSDGEREQLNETIRIMSEAGFTAEEASLTYMGFDIDISDKDKVGEYINIGRNLGDDAPESFFPTVSNYINADDYEGAEKYISNVVEDKVKSRYGEDFIPESTMDNATRNITEIIRLIENNKDKIGAVDGRIKKLMKKHGADSDIQQLQTLMTGTFADLRKNFAGSAVTETELQALADYIAGDIKEQPDNLITKLETLLTKQTNEFVGQREQFGYTPSNYGVQDYNESIVTEETGVEPTVTEEDDIDTLTEYYFPTN